MGYKRALTIQDISCFGQCSLTVALPVISACGTETCVLPSAVLSTHTSGFKDYTCLDMTDEMKKILAHWAKLDIRFDAIYTGYLATAEQIDIVKGAFGTRLKDGGLKIVDPVMGDFGKLYPAFDMDFVGAMKELCSVADVILPNVTEACLLTGKQYKFSKAGGKPQASSFTTARGSVIISTQRKTVPVTARATFSPLRLRVRCLQARTSTGRQSSLRTLLWTA